MPHAAPKKHDTDAADEAVGHGVAAEPVAYAVLEAVKEFIPPPGKYPAALLRYKDI